MALQKGSNRKHSRKQKLIMKLTKRKGFNFFRSYYDVYNMLPPEEKVAFMDALLDRQFLGVKPTELEGMAKFAYVSQTNSIDSQVKGYEDKTKTKLNPLDVVLVTPTDGGKVTPTAQVEEKGKEKGKEKEVTTTKKAVDFNLNNNYKNNLLKDSFLLENFSRIFKTNKKTILHYLEEFNTHLITTQEIKENQKEYQKHFSNWYNKKPRQTIKEQTRNLYKDLDKDL